jgi:hypothetical protein
VTVIPMGGSHLALPETEELCQRFLEAISEALDTAVSSKLGSDLVGQSYADI